MTPNDFMDLIAKKHWKIQDGEDPKSSNKWVVNPANGQKVPWSEEVYRDLINVQGLWAGDDMIGFLVNILEHGIASVIPK